MSKICFLFLSVFILISCTASKTPTRDGFFGGIVGISTGAYESEVSSKEVSLVNRKRFMDEAVADNKKLSSKLKLLEQEEKEHELLLAKNKRMIQKLELQIRKDKVKLDGLRQKTALNNSKTVGSELKKQTDDVQSKIKIAKEKLKIQMRIKQKLLTPEE